MTRRRDALTTLLRVRRLERDVCVLEQGKLSRARDAAEEAVRASDDTASAEQRTLDGQVRDSMSGALWRNAAAGVAALWSVALGERAALEGARAAEAEGDARRLAAERSVEALERLAARQAQALRKQARRTEQRRLDDSGRRKAGTALCLLLALGAMLALTWPAGAEAETRLASASLERLLSDIRTRMLELERREAELDERERSVSELERAVEARLDELGALSQGVEDRIASWEESHSAKSISKLSKIYGAMPPPRAAQLIEELDIELATHILAKMKPKVSAALLPLLSEPRALEISRLVGHALGIPPAATVEAK
jgi:flagellar motility protein MotE (MotC chaperone)